MIGPCSKIRRHGDISYIEDDFLMDMIPKWPDYIPKNSNQMDLDLVEPLTDQLKLDLDFKPCYDYENRRSLTYMGPDGHALTVANGTGVNWVSQNPSNICVDVENLTVLVKNRPNILKRTVMRLLNLKWKIK